MLWQSRRRHTPKLIAVASAAALAGLAASAARAVPPQIAAKEAQARAVLAQVQELDSRLEHAAEAYNYATIQLGQIDRDLRANGYDLAVARRNFRSAELALQRRLVTLYTSGDEPSALAVLLGSRSLLDGIDRLDAVKRISDQDAALVRQVREFRTKVAARQARLQSDRRAQRRIVAQREAKKAWIEGQLKVRRKLLASVQSEVARLQAQERVRQERLRQLALARFEAQQAAARRAAQLAAARRSVVAQRAATRTAPAGADPTPASSPLASGPAFLQGGADTTARAQADPPPPARYGAVVGIALRYLGVPYVWGGASPTEGFDCSGFTMYVFAQLGVSLPHYAAAQYAMGAPVSKDELQPGDLVFFDGLGHVGIYIGGGQFVQAPRTGDVVKISSLSEPWYTEKWVGARRL